MTFLSKKRNVRMLTKRDKHFTFNDGFAVVNRAAIKVNENCPDEYKSILLRAIQYGWVESVAYMTEEEMVFAGLSQ